MTAGLRRLAAAVAVAVLAAVVSPSAFAQDGQDRPTYLDPERSVPARAADLVARMTLEEKIGQLAMVDLSRLMGDGPWDRGPLNEGWVDAVLAEAQVGSLLAGGNGAPVPDDPSGWATTIDALQRRALDASRLGVPILFGVDAVHGHAQVRGATVQPHQLGLAASFDVELVEEVARATAHDVAATGVTWNFAPVADLGRDARWGRTYETFGEAPALAAEMAAAHVRGQLSVPRVAPTVKHFVGYGQAERGDDRAPAGLTLRELRDTHLPPFAAAVEAGAPTVMVASGAVDGVPVHASRFLLTGVLRGELGFRGVTLSDWADVDKLAGVHRVAPDRVAAVAMALNAGVDVVMLPHDAAGFVSDLRAAVRAGLVAEARIDEAASRVLELKLRLGLFETPFVSAQDAPSLVGAHRELARRAASASAVLLENRADALPLTGVSRIVVTGHGADDPAAHVGGWTLGWQGPPPGDAPRVVTVAHGLREGAPAGVTVEHAPPSGPPPTALTADDLTGDDLTGDDTAVVLVLAEPPYAEGLGDSDDLSLPAEQIAFAERVAVSLDDERLVVVLLAGRPIVLPSIVQRRADAILMAWLPGSEAGPAVADLLYGRTSPSGRLPVTWPASAGQLPITGDAAPSEAPLAPRWPVGHGLGYTDVSYRDARAELDGELVRLSVVARNDGEVAADEVTLAHVRFPVVSVVTPRELLVGFGRTRLEPGEERRVQLRTPLARLARVPGDVGSGAAPQVAAGRYAFELGGEVVEIELPGCAPTDCF